MIKFYSPANAFGEFSNFYLKSFYLEGVWWPTSEHYFQAKKYEGTSREALIRMAPSPRDAANLGRDRKYPLRQDWELVKDDIMMDALRAKFSQHRDLCDVLLNTGEKEIIENSPIDSYWGIGKDGMGKNKLGILLMRLREEFLLSGSAASPR